MFLFKSDIKNQLFHELESAQRETQALISVKYSFVKESYTVVKMIPKVNHLIYIFGIVLNAFKGRF